MPPVPEPMPEPASPRRGAIERVEIQGANTDAEQRRQAIAGKIVIGREEIERFGDSTVGEVLRRLPSITLGGRPGRGGEIRLRGMGSGFTQILINGERMPAGLALDSLTPDQIERIELMRAPTAEHGARAIAGTINIVLREPLERRLNDLRLSAGLERGRLQPRLAWIRNDRFGEKGSYNFSLSALRQDRRDDLALRTRAIDAASGATLLEQEETGESFERRDRVQLVSRLQWRHGPGEFLMLTPFIVAAESRTDATRQLAQTVGNVPLPYASSRTAGDASFSLLRLNALEQRRLGSDARIELRGALSAANWRGRSLRLEFDAAQALTRSLHESTDNSDRTWTLGAKYSRHFASEHNLVTGAEAESTTRRQERETLQNGAPLLADLGDAFGARTRRIAAYVQDEWNVSKTWSAHAGLRWEGITTRSDSAGSSVNHTSSVWTPLLHSVWRLDERRRDQIRASLTRSYRAPSLQDLIARPALTARYAPPGPNVATSPDRVGNPDLRPELARGVELAYEKYLPAGGVLSANLFHRRITGLIRNVTGLEAVPWAAVPRWVQRPQNLEGARVTGLELEAKFSLDELLSEAPALALRGNLSVFRSKVEGVPGPDNRIDRQPKGSANFGADYRLRSAPLRLGGSVNWVPAYRLQITDTQSTINGAKRVADLYALWTVDRDVQLRLSAANILPRDYANASAIVAGNTIQSVETSGPTWSAWALRLELKL
ncbi:MAG: TonB-dependent receptor [Betaproteobacteria bacterium]|nr:MAG: TonB-dependent receptor [Betaproteobacteria bacterium]